MTITPSRIGQADASGGSLTADTALFLKVFSGEILGAFNEVCTTANRVVTRTISSGKSAQFPATWKASAAFHIPGTELTGAVIKGNERIINIDAALIAQSFIAQIDEAMNHYDVRSEYRTQLGAALALQSDKFLLQLMCLAARASATVSGGYGGTELSNVDYDTSPNTLALGVFAAAQALDEKDVPDDGMRYAFFRPAYYYNLVQSDKAVNRDWNSQEANGSFKSGKIMQLAGVDIVKSNQVPHTDLSAITTPLVDATTTNNTYEGDFSDIVGVVTHRTAVGTVKLRDIAFEMETTVRNQGTLMVSKMWVGHGILRPEAAVTLDVTP